jgi:ATP-dependent DNA ligase
MSTLYDFSNKESYNFSIKNGKIIFGEIYNSQNGRTRFWRGTIELYDGDDLVNIKSNMINKDKFNEMFGDRDAYTSLYVNYGLMDGKITQSENTVIDIGKNIGKSNETTVLTQALIQMRALYLKKINGGYALTIEEENTTAPFSMALQTYDKMKKKIKFPCFVQPKLDGIRLIASKKNDEISFLSRRNKVFRGFDNIKDELHEIADINDLYLDGELYKHGMHLQEISSIVRQDENFEKKNELQFHIFDCFITSQPDLTFEERYDILVDIFNSNNFKYLVLVTTRLINNFEEGDDLFDYYLNKKYEGIVYKNKDAKYEFSYEKEKRSSNFLKRKKMLDSEYKIVDYTDGPNGKGVGSIIFILETKNGDQFKSTPKMSLEERARLFKDAKTNFDTKFKGKMATIIFDDLSKDGIPLRSRFIAVRSEYD